MKSSLILLLTFCIYLPVHADAKAPSKPFFDPTAFEEFVDTKLETQFATAFEKYNQLLYNTFSRCVEKGAYTSVGTIAALCGCFLTTTGIRRALYEKNKVRSGLIATCAGLAAVFIGLNIATITT
jgi:hypothetical protein